MKVLARERGSSPFGRTARLLLAAGLLGASSTAVAQSALPPLKVIQLGDSYSAGNGARDASGDRNYVGVSGCYRSPTNWGSQFVESLGDVFSVTYVNRACSGGVIDDVLGSRRFDQDLDIKIVAALGCPDPEFPDEESYTIDDSIDGIDRCIRTLAPQIEAVDNSVDIVLMTGGGNDARFADVVAQCFVPGPRDAAGCLAAIEFAEDELPAIEERLVSTFREMRGRLRDDARVVFLTYPYLAPDIDYRLSSLFGGLEVDAGNRIRALGLAGDARQSSAVERINAEAGEEFVTLVDGIKELFEGHLPNPIQTEPRNADRWLHTFETTRPAEWYHYNPIGHDRIAATLSLFGTFGAVGGSFDSTTDIDVAFVVDTTGSMGDEIAQVRADLSALVAQLASTTNSYRVAVVSYRDFSERTGSSRDYPARIDQTFSADLATIQAAIDSLSAEGGGDFPETVFSGMDAAIGLPWRPGVTKVALVIGDAPAFSPEPISGLTAAGLIQASIEVDPVQIIGVNVGSLDSNGAVSTVADGTGGSVVNGSMGLTSTISGLLDVAVNQPFAWLGVAYSGKTGEPIAFDASGSYDPSGEPISLYEWDFDNDGVFDLETSVPFASNTYASDYADFAVLRVTGSGGEALGSARVVSNALGYRSQGDEQACELDGEGLPILADENGRPIACTIESLPSADADGVVVTSGDTMPPDGPIGAMTCPTDLAPTIYVEDGMIVGGRLDGNRYRGALIGTSGPDVIFGTDGRDNIRGGGGDDIICGLGERDRLHGGNGDDQLFGGEGRDLLYGERGNDAAHGGADDDRVVGSIGDDLLRGDDGDDDLDGQTGDDDLAGGEGDDRLIGGPGEDRLFGDAGDDRLFGQNQDDYLDGGAGKDSVFGQNGTDTCLGETVRTCEL